MKKFEQICRWVLTGTFALSASCGTGIDPNQAFVAGPSCTESLASLAPWQGTRQLGVAGKNVGSYSIAADTLGNVFTTGYSNGGLDGNALTGTQDLFLAKYDSAGTKLWLRQLGVASKITYATGVGADSSGNVYAAGYTNGGLDGNALTGTEDFFIAKYDGAGTRLWTRQLGVASKSTYAKGVAVDSSGNAYVAGQTTGGLDGNTLMGSQDAFIAKYDSAGTKLWTKQLGVASKSTQATSIAVDSTGNAYIAGPTSGGLDGNTVTGSLDLFIAKYDAAGTKLWTRQLGVASKTANPTGVATDGAGNAYVAGYTDGGLDGNTLTGTTDAFVVKYDASGTKLWTRQLGVASKNTNGYAVATDPSSNVYITGDATGALEGATQTGTRDLFLIKFDSSGTKLWTRQLGVASKSTYASAISINCVSSIYLAGETTGGLDGNALTGGTDFFVTQFDSSGTKR